MVPTWLNAAASTLRDRLLMPGTPEFWMLVGPVLAYWAVAAFYEALDACPHPVVARRRVTRKEPGRANSVTRLQVFQRVLVQHALQMATLAGLVLADPQQCDTNPPKGVVHSAVQFVLAMFVMDAWQYWIHRWMHVVPSLYKHIHSTHHRLYMNYAMGALYNHPLEAFLLDTVGGGVAMLSTGMSCQLSTAFFMASTIKTVVDHSGYRWPFNPLHDLFPNSAAFHDVHHDLRYIKTNFSQPFFTHWDWIMGTYLSPDVVHMSQKEIDTKLAMPGTATTAISKQKPARSPAKQPTGVKGENGHAAKPAITPGAPLGTPNVTTRSRSRVGTGPADQQ